MIAELKTLLWLQWKLTVAMFRRCDAQGLAYLAQVLALLLQLFFTLPFFVLMGIGLAIILVLVSPQAAYEVVLIVNVFLGFFWLLLPFFYNGQVIERFEISRLFVYPIRFRSIVIGSTLVSMLTMVGLWTLPIILGEVVGLAWHAPLALPLILLGAIPTFLLLVLSGRIMEDLFDLVVGDRRLRALLISLLALPFMLLSFSQYIIQFATDNYQRVPGFLQRLISEQMIAQLRAATSASQVLEIIRPSRVLGWLPIGWATNAMGLATTGAWGRALFFLVISVAFTGTLFAIHATITRRLMSGAALRLGTERVRSTQWRWNLPGPPGFWAAFQKDWIYLFRSPLLRRMLLSLLFPLFSIIVTSRAFQSAGSETSGIVVLVLGIAAVLVPSILNIGITANYFGAIDREGFATLALSPLDRRYLLLSWNLLMFLLVVVASLALMAVVGILTRLWVVIPLGFYLALCQQLSATPAYNLAAIVGPYRTQLEFQGRQRGTAWALLGFAAQGPVMVLILLPYALWKPALIVTLPLAGLYSAAIYIVTLQPLARLLQRREYDILRAVARED